MKNKKNLRAILAAGNMEQTFENGFSPMIEQQQQARTGAVTALGGVSVDVLSVAQSAPLSASVGQLTPVALAAAAEKVVALASFPFLPSEQRTLKVWNADQFILSGEVDTQMTDGAGEGMVLVGVLQFEGGAKKNAPLALSGGEIGPVRTALAEMIAPAKPSFSVSSLLQKVEDIAAATNTPLLALVDQVGEEVRVFKVASSLWGSSFLGSIQDIPTMASFVVTPSAPGASAVGTFGE